MINLIYNYFKILFTLWIASKSKQVASNRPKQKETMNNLYTFYLNRLFVDDQLR